jgi:hypothetical protein
MLPKEPRQALRFLRQYFVTFEIAQVQLVLFWQIQKWLLKENKIGDSKIILNLWFLQL